MSQAKPLSDQQVDQELRKMTAFIKQEAMEKAREIEIKANEEFAIEKSKLVREETDSIDTTYEKKFKQATMSQQTMRSTVANKTRLKVLGARHNMLEDIFEETRKKLSEGSKDKSKYQGIMKNLILEGLYALNEPDVRIRARKKDFDVAKKAADEAAKEAKSKSGKDISVSLIDSDPLPEGCAGGVIVVGGGGKIDIDNTFEARLELLKNSALPGIRTTLFGKNPNRKYYD